MRNVLTGCVNNVSQHLDKIKVWVRSFQEVSTDEICLIVINPTKEEEMILGEMGISIAPYKLKHDETVNNVRLQLEWETIKGLNADYVLVTDVFDVMFQDNPFTKIVGKDITVGWEGVKHSEEPWNMDVLQKSYPHKTNDLRELMISCSGVIGGKKDKIVELLQMMDKMTMGKGGHDIRDQAVLNIIIQEQKLNITTLTPSDGWVLHCAVGGPTNFYKDWGFQRHMIERFGEAKNIDGIITTQDDKIYDIVHQFNRIETWNKQLTTRYLV